MLTSRDESYVRNQFYEGVKYLDKDMPRYSAAVKQIVLVALGMDPKNHCDQAVAEEGCEYLEPLVQGEMRKIKNANNKAFRKRLRDCKCSAPGLTRGKEKKTLLTR